MPKRPRATRNVAAVLLLAMGGGLSGCSRGDDVIEPGGGEAGYAFGGSGGTGAGGADTGGSSGAPAGGTGATAPTGGGAGSSGAAATGGAGTGGSAGNDTGGSGGVAGQEPVFTAGRGADVPWIEYEAEQGETDGTIIGPSRTFGDMAAEASGRRAVRLDATGQGVSFTATEVANAIVVRYSIPDAAGGGGIDATLNLYVDGQLRQALQLTSRYAWVYGGETETDNNPGRGGAHRFYDESRALVGDIPVGAEVRLQKDGDNTAEYYVIDLVDLEQVGPPLSQPDGYLSISDDCGASPDDGSDDGWAIQMCVDQARAEGRGLYIPPGTFDVTSRLDSDAGIMTRDVAIRGAGMWYSVLQGYWARFHCIGNGCQFYDFSILGETTTRDDRSPENGFNGGAGQDSRLENIWVEHTKVGFWVGAGESSITDGLVIASSRFRNLFADGINFNSGTHNSEVVNCHFRNTGDDALASWASSSASSSTHDNAFRFNTVQLPWRANCYAVYGGTSITLEDNVCADTITYPGILIGGLFDSYPFDGTILVQRNSLLRAGGPMWDQEHGALKLLAEQMNVSGIVVRDILIDSPTYSGIDIQGPNSVGNTSFTNVVVQNPGTHGIVIKSNATGSASFANVSVTGASSGGLLREDPEGTFSIVRESGNSGW